MPPRYVYWTIIVDGQPTAFRAGSLEDIMPTFNRLKEKQPTAELKWFQHGKLWPSRHDAQDFMRARGDRGRERDPRQSRDQGSGIGDQGSDRPERAWNAKPDWKTRSTFKPRGDKPAWKPKDDAAGKPAWVPKSASIPKPEEDQVSSWDEEPSAPAPADFAPKAEKPRRLTTEKPEWKPKGSFTPAARRDDDKPAWKPKSFSSRKPPSFAKATEGKPEWKPKGTFKPKEAGHSSGWGEKPGWKSKDDRGENRSFAKPEKDRSSWKPKGDKPEWKGSSSPKPQASSRGDKPEWKPKGTFRPKEEGHRPSAREEARSSFRPKSYTPREEGGGPSRSAKARDQKLDWKPASGRPSARPAERRGDGPNAGFTRSGSPDQPASDAPKRKWVPKAEYKKSLGIEVKRDDKWRPGGEHRDPKQKYKDAKKAKWGRFKEAIRSRSTKPKKRDE